MNLVKAIYEMQNELAKVVNKYSEFIPATVMADKFRNLTSVLDQQAELQYQAEMQKEKKEGEVECQTKEKESTN